VLIRLDEISREKLEIVLVEAWRCMAPREWAEAALGEPSIERPVSP